MKKRVHIKSYTRMPYILHSGRATAKVSPKRTREHNRLIGAVDKFSKDLKKTVETEKKHLRKHQQSVVAQKKSVQRQLLEAKRQQAREKIEELGRTRAVLDAQNKLAETRIAGLDTLEAYRKRRLPVVAGSPASKAIGKIRARSEYEKVRDDIIKSRAESLRQLEVMRTQRITNEAQLQAIRRGTKEEREMALRALSARTAESPLAKITAAVATLPGKVTAPAKKIEFIMNAQREAVEAAQRKAQEQARESTLRINEAIATTRAKGAEEMAALKESNASKERIESVKRGVDKETDFLTRQAAQETAERNALTQLEIAKINAEAQAAARMAGAISPESTSTTEYKTWQTELMKQKAMRQAGGQPASESTITSGDSLALPPEKKGDIRVDVR